MHLTEIIRMTITKPELMVALGDFWLLHGFKPVEKLRMTLGYISELKPLLEIFDATGYDQLYKTVMRDAAGIGKSIITTFASPDRSLYRQGQLKKNDENFWAARASLIFNGQSSPRPWDTAKIDRGIFLLIFFNLLYLQAGEGVSRMLVYHMLTWKDRMSRSWLTLTMS